MSESPARNDAKPADAVAARRRCDAICDEFEQVWMQGARPRLNEFLDKAPAAERGAILRELVALDGAYRRELGETPVVADYVPLLPSAEAAIAEALSTRMGQQSLTGRDRNDVESTIARQQPIDTPAVDARSRIGDYQIIAEIARGGMGVVYQARHVTLDRLAAVKLIRSGAHAGTEELKRFELEAAAAAQLDHPGIVPVFELGRHDGQPYLAMAYVEGTSLWSRVKEAPLEPRLAAQVMQQASVAVQYAHDRGIIHRDLKPQNILLTKDDQPRITDFGLAKRHAADSSLTATGQVLGTPSYMPPEQAAGRDDLVGPLADVYSLGATLYCLLVGHPPFQSAQPIDTLRQVMELEPVAPRQLNRSIPRDLETICLKCLQKPTSKRYASAAALAADLQRFLQGEPIQARPIGSIERAFRWCARNPVVAGLSSTAIVLLIVIAAISTTAYFQQKQLVGEKTKLLGDKETLLTEKTNLIGQKDILAKSERVQREAAERELRNSQIARSQAELARGNVIAAQVSLESIPFPLRHWEHRYLTRQTIGTPFLLEGHRGEQFDVAFSPDGALIATGGQDGAHLWDAHTGQKRPNLQDHRLGPVLKLAFTPQGDRLIGVSPRAVQTWEIPSGEIFRTSVLQSGVLIALAVAKDGKSIAVGDQGGLVGLLDIETGEPRLRLKAGEGEIRSLDLNPNGSQLAVAIFKQSGRGELKVFSTSDGQLVHNLDSYLTYCQPICFSPDGRFIATATDLSIRLWDAVTGAKVRDCEKKKENDAQQAIRFSPDGLCVAGVSFDKTLRIWDVHTGQELALYRGHHLRLNSLDFNHDGSRIVTSAWGDAGNAEIKVWNVANPPGDVLLHGHTDRVNIVDFARNGDILASGSNDRTIKLWDVATRRELRTLKGHSFSIFDLAISPTGKLLLSTSIDGKKPEVKVWDVASGRELFSVSGHNDWVLAAGFSADERYLVTASRDGTARVFDVEKQQHVTELRSDLDEVVHAQFHPTEPLLLTVGKGTKDRPQAIFEATLWEVPSWKRIRSWTQQEMEGGPGEFTPSGKWLLGSHSRGEMVLRDWRTNRLVRTFKGHLEPLSGSTVDANDSRLFSSSWDRTVKVWDVDEGKEILTLPLGAAVPAQIKVHPSGDLVAVGQSDHAIRLLDARLDREECILRGHTAPIRAWGLTPQGILVTRDATDTTICWEAETGRRVEQTAPSNALRPIERGAEPLQFDEVEIAILPTEPMATRLRRPRKFAGDDLWSLDAQRLAASERNRHLKGAADAEKHNDLYAAAFHWGALLGDDTDRKTAEEKYAAAVKQLQEAQLPVPKAPVGK